MRYLLIAFLALLALPAAAEPQHAIALHGAPKYPATFTQLDYVNPAAPVGGSFTQAAFGTFDSVNPFILKGTPAQGVGDTFATLMTQTLDEPFTAYGYAAESIDVAPDRKSVTFKLRPGITFHDGSKIAASDVVWTFNTLRTKGHPMYRIYYGDVVDAKALDAQTVRFTFKNGENRELPLILGQLPILSEAYFKANEFDKTTLTPLLGSGPYKIANVDAGRRIVYERVADWWGHSLPIMKGRNNFATQNEDYYRDYQVAFEAFAAGKLDFRIENIARQWAEGYNNIPAYKDGKIIKRAITVQRPAPAQGFIFNIRRAKFADPRVREALSLAYDFEWANKQFAYGSYVRLRSYFGNTDLEATGLPGPGELQLLEPFRAQLPTEVFIKEFQPPKTDGSGNVRDNLKRAQELLAAAGWTLKDGALKNVAGEVFTFEILNDNDGGIERWVQPWMRHLERLGVKATYRVIDAAQMQSRQNDFDFDCTIHIFPQSLSPGNEQRDFWASDKADVKGSKNLIGIKSAAVDALIEKVVAAQTREELITATHALDRVLQWGFYMVPHWYSPDQRLAYWDKFAYPANNPPYGVPLDAWWVK